MECADFKLLFVCLSSDLKFISIYLHWWLVFEIENVLAHKINKTKSEMKWSTSYKFKLWWCWKKVESGKKLFGHGELRIVVEVVKVIIEIKIVVVIEVVVVDWVDYVWFGLEAFCPFKT